jgi:hypothetical protein
LPGFDGVNDKVGLDHSCQGRSANAVFSATALRGHRLSGARTGRHSCCLSPKIFALR